MGALFTEDLQACSLKKKNFFFLDFGCKQAIWILFTTFLGMSLRAAVHIKAKILFIMKGRNLLFKMNNNKKKRDSVENRKEEDSRP